MPRVDSIAGHPCRVGNRGLALGWFGGMVLVRSGPLGSAQFLSQSGTLGDLPIVRERATIEPVPEAVDRDGAHGHTTSQRSASRPY